ncbi:hypothetical protein ETAA8_19840 [Anatilimnocola aggregata]|uniref:Carboxypeptidase regulatory-like domain-containing protein n=1 Tax=Anatilimnocola aggregata TaxID=2528021 RepID=A0A517Y9J4_9BACT|nr:hypothetical protein [Anatilimnocola aggregata]QDU26900.1 hypothetical protein ETAA8_19840 [Anatilimnocola aggregata]
MRICPLSSADEIRTDRIARCAVVLSILLGLSTGLISGCSWKEPTYPVKGKVVYQDDGSPAAVGVRVVFESTKPPYARASGAIQPDGSFVLSTDRPDNGAMQGEHRVAISPLTADGTGNDLTAQLTKTIGAKYLEFRTSNLVFNIEPKGSNDFVVKIERPPGARR